MPCIKGEPEVTLRSLRRRQGHGRRSAAFDGEQSALCGLALVNRSGQRVIKSSSLEKLAISARPANKGSQG